LDARPRSETEGMTDCVSLDEMSPAQRLFAHSARATYGVRADRGTYLYRDEPWATYRYLVDGEGRTLQTTRFLKSA
jgi:hypothetical protein